MTLFDLRNSKSDAFALPNDGIFNSFYFAPVNVEVYLSVFDSSSGNLVFVTAVINKKVSHYDNRNLRPSGFLS